MPEYTPPTIPTDPSTIAQEYGSNIIDLNHSLFQHNYPYPGHDFGRLLLHIIIGQLPSILKLRYNIDNNFLDLRVHGTVFAPSGTNKGSGFNYISNLASALSVNFKIMGKLTDAALVGWMDSTYEDGEKILLPQYGCLHPSQNNNILAWSEGTDIFDIRKIDKNQHTMNNFQKTMNPIGTPDNMVSVASGIGEVGPYTTSVSLLFVTYKPFTLTTETLKTGMLQRQICQIHEPTLTTSQTISLSATDKLLTSNPTIPSDLTTLIHRLRTVNHFASTISSLSISPSSRKSIQSVQSSFYDTIHSSNIIIRPKLGEFVRRWSVNQLYNIMFHHALLRLSSTITDEDVLYSRDFLLPIWTSFVAFLESSLTLSSTEYKLSQTQIHEIISTYVNLVSSTQPTNYWIPLNILIKHLSHTWNISIPSAEYRLSQYLSSLFDLNTITHSSHTIDSPSPKSTVIKLKPGVQI